MIAAEAVTLPGGADAWPLDVKVDGKPAATTEDDDGVPAVRLPAGTHAVTGTFVVSYGKKYQKATPDDVAALTYDAFGLLSKAIGGAGQLDRAAIRDAMAKIAAYDGVTGKTTYKPGSGDPVPGAYAGSATSTSTEM